MVGYLEAWFFYGVDSQGWNCLSIYLLHSFLVLGVICWIYSYLLYVHVSLTHRVGCTIQLSLGSSLVFFFLTAHVRCNSNRQNSAQLSYHNLDRSTVI